VVDEARGVIVGMTLIGPGVGELIHAAIIAISARPRWAALARRPSVSHDQ
jgi:pyruvate/2-oxoglutarate dehydrogenase complex dihydrolipoamide dehydrogenase (E3) component